MFIFFSKYVFPLPYSDAIRIILLNRFGGWYSDMDFVFLRPFDSVMGKYGARNVMAAADVDFHDYDNLLYNWGNVLADGLFHVEAGHIFLEAAMIIFNDTLLNGKNTYSGSLVLTKSLEEICGQRHQQKRPFNPIDYGRTKCTGMTIIDPQYFYPVDASNAQILGENHFHSYWYEIFKNAVAVHFSGGNRLCQETLTEKGKRKKDDSRNLRYLRHKVYGKTNCAMSFIGPKECPLSFFSNRPL